MPLPDKDSLERLKAYLLADTLYSVSPIPAPIDRASGVLFVTPRVRRTASRDHIVKLSRASIFHNLRDTAKVWEVMLDGGGEGGAEEYEKSAHAVAALAWVGDEKAKKKAADYYRGMLRRASADSTRESMALACAALGSAEGAKELAKWAADAAEQLEMELNRSKASLSPDGARNMRARADMISQFARLEAPRLQASLQVRQAVEAMPPEQRIARLAAIYCDTDPQSDAELIWWAAVTLVRLPDAENKLAPVIAARFLDIANEHDKEDKVLQPELDMTRACALRAAIFFDGEPGIRHRMWLNQQQDTGTDLLTLRPHWEYPAPHVHGEAEGHAH